MPAPESAWCYPNGLWDGYVSFNLFGDAMDPALGFLPRTGARQYDVYVDYRPRPTADWLRWVRQFFYQFEVMQVDDLHGRTQTRQIFTVPINADAESGEHYEFDWIPEYEALTEPFEIADGVCCHPAAIASTATAWRRNLPTRGLGGSATCWRSAISIVAGLLKCSRSWTGPRSRAGCG